MGADSTVTPADSISNPDSLLSSPPDSIQVIPGTGTSVSPVQDSTVRLPVLKDSLILDQPLIQDTVGLHPAIQNSGFKDTTRFLDSSGMRKDSTGRLTDSLAADTIKIDSMTLDSTARLKYFHPHREDVPYVKFNTKRQTKFFAVPSQKIRSVKIDSTGQYVEIVEKVAGQENKILLRVPIEQYIQLQIALRERKLWEDLGYKYELKESQKGLAELIKDITDFEIPLPSVGVLSIFGEPKISLRIGGAVDIHGAWRTETTEGVTASRLGNTRNEPDFKQQVQINVSGTIGDKLNINADWNTERTFEYENQLKIKYTGYEDEIIQNIEAGNVSLQTSPLVGGSEALFGLKAQFKMGPFSLTTIATQKKGEVKEVSINSGSTSQEFSIRAYNYSKNHYFVDVSYADLFNDYYSRKNQTTPTITQSRKIVAFEVWKSINTIGKDPQREREANAYIDLDSVKKGVPYDEGLRKSIESPPIGRVETGRFLKLTDGQDYILHPETGFITFKTQIQDNDIIAVAYQVQNNPTTSDDDYTYGEFVSTAASDSQKLILKLVKPRNLNSQLKPAWDLLLKNIYPIGGRNINREGFEFNIKYEVEGSEPLTDIGNVRLLNGFGLDEYDAAGSKNPDNIFDFEPSITIIPETGEIIFPVLKPFSTQYITSIGLDTANTKSYDDVYDTLSTLAQNSKINDKWVMTGKYSGEASSVYQLGFNIVENSVKVRLNGAELTAGIDFSVDYNIGQLTLRNDAALVPGADLKISYEQNDLFQLASKTLLGARGLFDISDKTKLGFSILNLNQQTLSDKVRIGEEPLSNTIMGVDFTTSHDLPFITKALSNIISTKTMSSISLTGEYAYMSPDPNTKKSTIESDKGESIAYIDDFEGTKRIIPIGTSYTAWKDMSPPDALLSMDGLTPRQEMSFKGKAWWYTITPASVDSRTIWPNRSVGKNDQNISVLDFVFNPSIRGAYNYIPHLDSTKKNWGGMMKVLSSTANNLIEENIEFIDIWMQVTEPGADIDSARFYIDLGSINEDVIPNEELNSEDVDKNGVMDKDLKEDTGLDGLPNNEEASLADSLVGDQRNDPSGDNFSLPVGAARPKEDWMNVNGTEGNSNNSDGTRSPDTEDINNNGNLDRVSSYFRYEVPLDTNAETNPYIAGGGDTDNHWHLYRIPLKDFKTKIGSPDLSTVEYIRFFVTGFENTTHFRIAEFNLVGNQWQKALPNDTILSVSVINVEENPNYTIPDGVQREKDRTRPDENVVGNEQSMNLVINGLEAGQSRQAIKYLYRPLDVFNYREMKLFIHGDPIETGPGSISHPRGEQFKSLASFRFGADSNNYYEYTQPVDPGWSEISIIFKDLTALKERMDSVGGTVIDSIEGSPGHYYKIKGQPSLTTVKFLGVAITNVTGSLDTVPQTLSGDVWVNELRVVGAEDTPGWAYSVSGSLKLADLLSLSFNMSQTDPYFHKLSDRFGSRNESKNWGFAADLDVLKLLPFKLDDSYLRINYSHTESLSKPLYVPGTDILVSQVAATDPSVLIDNQTMNISDSWSASNIKIKIPTSFWLIRDSFNALTFGFNYNKTFSRSPTVLTNKSWVWNATVNYGINLSPEYYFRPVDIPVLGTIFALFSDYKNTKVYYTPQNFAFTMNAKRNRNINVTRERTKGTFVPSQTAISRDFTTQRGFNFSWKLTEGGLFNLSTTYTVNINSSLAHLETDNYVDSRGIVTQIQRPEGQIWKDIFTSAFFGKDYQYSQSIDIRTSPRLPSLWDLNRFFTVNAGYSVSYQWQNDLKQEDLGRSAGFSNRSSVGLTLRLKALSDPLFAEANNTNNNGVQPPIINRNRNVGLETRERLPRDRNMDAVNDTVISEVSDSVDQTDTLQVVDVNKKSAVQSVLLLLKLAAKTIFFDYESITFNFSNDNQLSKSGIYGTGNGFNNFWGISYKGYNGPSRGFMFGLDPNVGLRAMRGNLSDVFSQKNSLDFKTSRPLWEGAKIDLNWKVNWSVNRTTTIITDSLILGKYTFQPPQSTGNLNRSFLAFPSFLFINGGLKKVSEMYNPDDPNASQNLSNAFAEGFEQFPLLSKLPFLKNVSKYIPRPNWRLAWDGLEKFSVFSSFAKRVSLEHAYLSSYTEGWKSTPEGTTQIQTQRVEYGFAPLAGITFTFNELWGGNLNSSIKYGTKTSYDLGISTSKITETFSKDIGITAGYSISGVEIPLFGISLKNDIEFSFSYTSAKNSTVIFDMAQFTEDGIPQDGTTRVTIEPRAKYTLSSKVTLSLFYRRSSVEPEGAARIPPTTTNEIGLDVHISIQ